MAKCEICAKDIQFGNNVSHSNRKTSRTYKPNLQTVRVNAGGNTTKKVTICTRCLKSGKVQKAI